MTTTVTAPTTRNLLTCAAIAAPLWGVVSLAQAATRAGFDLTRHPLSALATGDLGWLQIANFVVAGILMVVGATGFRRAMAGAPGGRWVPRLMRLSGLGMIASGMLVMDPIPGFPAGTPGVQPADMSWHSVGHMVAGTITFSCLIAACYVLVRHFSRTGSRRAAVGSVVAGTALLVGYLWAMTGGPAGSLTLAIGALSAMLWTSYAAYRLR